MLLRAASFGIEVPGLFWEQLLRGAVSSVHVPKQPWSTKSTQPSSRPWAAAGESNHQAVVSPVGSQEDQTQPPWRHPPPASYWMYPGSVRFTTFRHSCDVAQQVLYKVLTLLPLNSTYLPYSLVVMCSLSAVLRSVLPCRLPGLGAPH